MEFNYGYLVLGNDIRIEGKVTHWLYSTYGTVEVTIDGVLYYTGVNNLILTRKEQE